MRSGPGDIVAIERDRSGGHWKNPADQVEHRRLTGTVRTDQTEDFALENRKSDTVDSRDTAEFLDQIIDLQQYGHDSHLLRLL